MRKQTLWGLLVAFFCILSATTVYAADINWQPYSKAVFAQAKKEHRQVLLFGKASWCPWCRRMKSETYSDSDIISLVNKNYIPVMIDIDDDSQIADQYNISVVPTVIILNSKQEVVKSKTGFQSASELTRFLDNAQS